MAIGKSFIAITISLQEIFATNDFCSFDNKVLRDNQIFWILHNCSKPSESRNFAQCVFETEKIEIENYRHCNRIFIVLFCRTFKSPIQNIQSQCAWFPCLTCTLWNAFIFFFVPSSVLQQIFTKKAKILFNYIY